MLDVTTITINGREGERFLASLAAYAAPIPRALSRLVVARQRSIAVDRRDADQIARFVDELLESGWIAVEAPPLLYSPRVGDRVIVDCDVLAEVSRTAPGMPPTWRFLPAGATGKLLGWCERAGRECALVDVDDTDRRLVVALGGNKISRLAPPLPRPPRPGRRRLAR